METSASFEARSAPLPYPTCRITLVILLAACSGRLSKWAATHAEKVGGPEPADTIELAVPGAASVAAPAGNRDRSEWARCARGSGHTPPPDRRPMPPPRPAGACSL